MVILKKDFDGALTLMANGIERLLIRIRASLRRGGADDAIISALPTNLLRFHHATIARTRIRLSIKARQGLHRTTAEDYFFAWPLAPGEAGLLPGLDALLIVADGVGGGVDAHKASSLTVGLVGRHILGMYAKLTLTLPTPEEIRKCIENGLDEANRILCERGQNGKKTCTTCTIAAITQETLHLMHVGDSALFLMKAGGKPQRLSEIHSDDIGLTRVVGKDAINFKIQVHSENLGVKDRILLCTDGFPMDGKVLKKQLCSEKSIETIAGDFISALKRSRLEDDATFILAEIEKSSSPIDDYYEFSRKYAADSNVWLQLGMHQIQAGFFEDAALSLVKSFSLDRRNVRALYELGRTLVQLGRSEEAIRHYLDAVPGDHELSRRTNFHEALELCLGELYYRLGRYEEALHMYRRDESFHARHIALVLESMGKDEEAFEYYGKALDSSPLDSRNYLALSEYYIRRKMWGEAEIAARDGFKCPHVARETLEGMYVSLATAKMKTGMLDEAVTIIEDANRSSPGNYRMQLRHVKLLFLQKKSKEARRAGQELIRKIEEETRVTPFASELWCTLGDCCSILGRMDQVREAYSRALQFNAIASEAVRGKGVLAERDGDYDTAIQFYREFTMREPLDLSTPPLREKIEELRQEIENSNAAKLLPYRKELFGKLLWLMNAPARRMLEVLNSPGRGIISLLNQRSKLCRKGPLCSAILRGNRGEAGVLLEKDTDANVKANGNWAYNWGLLHWIHWEDEYGRTPLHRAIVNGNQEEVKSLLAKGAPFATNDSNSMTSLHCASASGHLEIVELLLKKGACINSTTADWWTPLHWASASGRLEVVELLLEKGADIDARNFEGWTPLHWASANGHREVVELLLAKGADIDARNIEGWTPLHVASKTGKQEIVELLLKKGADISSNARTAVAGPEIQSEALNAEAQELTEETRESSRGSGKMPDRRQKVKLSRKIALSAGQRVTIIHGPFRELHGIVEEVNPKREKVKVLVALFGRETSVELELSQVAPEKCQTGGELNMSSNQNSNGGESQMDSFQPSVPLGRWIQANADFLYKTNLVMLREALQNAVDATRMSDSGQPPLIEVSYESDKKLLIVSDNGIGMTLDEQKRCFWEPYGTSKRDLQKRSRLNQGIIGQFGIGAYAAFQVARRIMVISRPENQSQDKVTGTWGALRSPLSRSDETPQPSFGELDQNEVERYWNKRSSKAQGTTVVIELVEHLDMREVDRWLKRACALLTHEKVTIEGVPVEPLRKPGFESLGAPRSLELNASQTEDIRALTIVPVRAGDGSLGVHVVAATSGDGEIPCEGLLFLSPEGKPPRGEAHCEDITSVADHGKLIFYKHQFHFLEWELNQLKVNCYGEERCLPLTGFLDFPFLNPHPSREAFDKKTDGLLHKLLAAISVAIAESYGEMGGEKLRSCRKFFDFVWAMSSKMRRKLLRNYPFRIYNSDSTISLDELEAKKSGQKRLAVIYLISADSDKPTKNLAKSFATLSDHIVLDLDGPEHWRGYALARTLQECVNARPILDEGIKSVLKEEEYGDWKQYLGRFTSALEEVLGSGWQVVIARVDPKHIRMVMAENKRIIYVNHLNDEVRELPGSGLIGTNLQGRIRGWAYGEATAREMEEILAREGKLLVTQGIRHISVVDNLDVKPYEPDTNDVFLHIKNKDEQFFCLRVPYLWQHFLKAFLKENDSFIWKMREGQCSRMMWAGPRLDYILSREEGEGQQLPSLLINWKTGVILRNDLYGFAGEATLTFRCIVFDTPTGKRYFAALPAWIGKTLADELGEKGQISIGIHMMEIPRAKEPRPGMEPQG
jgi:ankyrin repeat protein/tetratricopeptide (TPR) repeat protein